MSTENEHTDIEKLTRRDPADEKTRATSSAPLVASTAYLQRQLTLEQDGRKDERFIWALVVMMLLDVIIFPSLEWHIILVLLIFEFLFLFVFGRMCGVDYIYKETQNAIDTLSRLRGHRPKQVDDDAGGEAS